MSIREREDQVETLKKIAKRGDELDVEEEFDELVDYLSEHGYSIVKNEYPETKRERTQDLIQHLLNRNDVRTVEELERWLKRLSQDLDLEPKETWQAVVKDGVARAAQSEDAKDFAELIRYIKAGYSFIKQTQDHE